MINWKVRIKNKVFWLAIIPAILILAQAVAAVFGYTLDFKDISAKLIAVVEAVFSVLAILGVVVDPTTGPMMSPNRRDSNTWMGRQLHLS